MISMRIRQWAGLVWLASAIAASAEALPVPRQDVVLTVEGRIGVTNTPEGAAFDLAMLESLDPVEFKTTTIWTEGPQSFRGVPLSRLISELRAEGTIILASALNDYTVEIPVTDAVEGGPILAFEQNGERLSVRDKGPLWIVYPYDSTPDYQTVVIYARSIWQVAHLEFR